MKTLAGCMITLALTSSSAWGGTVTFTPGTVSVGPAGSGDLVAFELRITDFDGPLGTEGDVGESFDAVDLLVGSNDGLVIDSFVFNSETVDPLTACSFSSRNCGAEPGPGVVYGSDFLIGFFAETMPAVLGDDGFLIGTLYVDASGLQSLPAHLGIDSDLDGGQSVAALEGPFERLHGTATISNPEPTTLALLGLASVALLRRRRTAS